MARAQHGAVRVLPDRADPQAAVALQRLAQTDGRGIVHVYPHRGQSGDHRTKKVRSVVGIKLHERRVG